ncbi:MAG: adenylate cyclase [Actinomycetia bacterium]|nr:adenylate cyclase [Actinomycetes bacterium]
MTNSTVSGEQLVEMIAAMKSSDSVELKQTIRGIDVQIAGDALGFDPIEAEIRQIVFFDTPDMTLYHAGVVARARRIQGGDGDSVIKLRPVNPSDLDPDVRESKHFGVETDVMPNGFVCSGSMKHETTAERVQDVLFKRKPIKSVFSKEQRRLFNAYAPEGMKLNELEVLGPVFVLKLKSELAEFERNIVAEVWIYPDGATVLELSTKSRPDEAFQVAAEFKAELITHGVDLSAEQATKTKTALEYFTTNL